MRHLIFAFCALVPLLSSCASSVATPETLGYNVPALEGWQKDEPKADEPKTDERDSDSIVYRKKVNNTKIRMMFIVNTPKSGAKPDDLTTLKQSVNDGLELARIVSPTIQVVEQKATSFRKFPAMLSTTRDKSVKDERERKILRVADGKNTFLIDQTLTGNPIDEAARKEADAAWEEISSQLQIKEPNA